jgi:spore coat protein H
MKRGTGSNIIRINLYLKFFFMVFFCSPLISSYSKNYLVQTDGDTLNLSDSDRKIENTISLFISRSEYQAIKVTTGVKTIVKAIALIINGDTLRPDEINTRGQSTLHFLRKSFSFNLKSKALFRHGRKTESLKKFFVLSLSMDRNYCNNRLAFEMMEASQIFGLFYSFCELRINDQSEGIHMVIERPEDWAMKKKNSPLLIRRGYNHKIDKIKTDKTSEKSEVKKYCNYYRQIYKCVNQYEGEALYKTLSNLLDIDVYMKWLGFNFLVRNGDFTDEVYFYFDPGIKKLSIIPWDYDDLYFPTPHEGNFANRELLEEKLIFSAEDLLDKKIAKDPYLYKIYLVHFKELLTQLSPSVLKRVFENTYAELYPYYSSKEIINMSGYDAYKSANLDKLKNYLMALYEKLGISRESCLTYLKNSF